MFSAAVIKHFDVFKNVGLCLHPSFIISVIDQLSFEGMKPTFHGRVISAVTFTAHAANYLVRAQLMLIIVAGILAALI